MARIFTLDFYFQGTTHQALVAMIWNDENISYSVRLGKDLAYITRDCVISIHTTTVVYDSKEPDLFNDLENSIKEAIVRYLRIPDHTFEQNKVYKH